MQRLVYSRICPYSEPEPDFTDPAKNRRGQNPVFIPVKMSRRQRCNGFVGIDDGGPGWSKAKTVMSRAARVERLQGLHHVERAVGSSSRLSRSLILLGDKIQTIAPRRPQSSFKFADAELHDVVFGLHAFGEKTLRLGRGGDNSVECPQADTAGESRHPRPAQFDKPECRGVLRVAIRQERIFEGAMAGTNLSVIRNRCWRLPAGPSHPTNPP